MSVFRIWVFRILILASIGLIMFGWFTPWWHANIVMIEANVWVRPWGLESDLSFYGAERYIQDAQMPVWFGPLMWTFLGISVLALLVGLFIKDRKISLGKLKISLPQLLIIKVGIAYTMVAIIGITYMAVEMSKYYGGMKLMGTFHMDLGEPMVSDVHCILQLGYWIICCVGPLLIILGLLRNKITGRAA
jgi:hypothetical protein